MTPDELADVVRHSMSEEMFRKPGAVLFSGLATVKPSRFYIMGLNPGGSSKMMAGSIIDTLPPPDETSAYTHQCWKKECGDNSSCEHVTGRRLADADLVRHQKNMICLTRLLGYDAPGEIPSANAIFARSQSLATLKNESGFSEWDWWKACWPVHQYLLELIQPSVIISLGYGANTSPLGFLAHQLCAHSSRKIGDANRRGGKQIDCSIRLTTSTIDVHVIGVPHPSYHAPGPQLSNILQMLARAC